MRQVRDEAPKMFIDNDDDDDDGDDDDNDDDPLQV